MSSKRRQFSVTKFTAIRRMNLVRIAVSDGDWNAMGEPSGTDMSQVKSCVKTEEKNRDGRSKSTVMRLWMQL